MIPGIVSAQGSYGAPDVLWNPGFLPVQPHVWVDWNSSITEVSGAASSLVNGGSASGSFSQGTAGARPTVLHNGLSGKRVLRFDGSNDVMVLASTAAGEVFRNKQSGWAFCVFRTFADVATAWMFYAPRNQDLGVRFGIRADGTPRALRIGVRRLDADAGWVIGGSTSLGGSWRIGMAVMDYSSATASLVLDAVSDGGGTAGTSGSTSNTSGFQNSISIGARTDGANATQVDIACMVVGAGAIPSSADTARLEGWAAWQCGLVDSLPPGHPYKSAPPIVE